MVEAIEICEIHLPCNYGRESQVKMEEQRARTRPGKPNSVWWLAIPLLGLRGSVVSGLTTTIYTNSLTSRSGSAEEKSQRSFYGVRTSYKRFQQASVAGKCTSLSNVSVVAVARIMACVGLTKSCADEPLY